MLYERTVVAALVAVALGAAPAYAAPGDFDATWGGDGDRTAPSANTESTQLALSGSRVLVAGGQGGDIRVTRFLADSAFDTSFAGDGSLVLSLGGTQMSFVDMLALPGGKILLVARGFPGPGPLKLVLIRLREDGTADPAFGTGGKIIHNFAGQATDALLQADGKIVVATSATASNESCADFGARRFQGDGAPDTTFGSSGIAAGSPCGGGPVAHSPRDVVQQPDGKLVLVGERTAFGSAGPSSDAVSSRIERLNSNGTLDSSFGQQGVVSLDLRETGAVALDGAGAIFVGGQRATSFFGGFGSTSGAVAKLRATGSRLGAAGTLDTSFGTGGIALAAVPRVTSFFSSTGFSELVRTPSGKLVAGGNFTSGSSFQAPAYVTRFRSDGTIDTAFGPAEASFPVNQPPTGVKLLLAPRFVHAPEAARLNGMLQQTDGKLILAGRPTSSQPFFYTVRFLMECEVFVSCVGSVVVAGNGVLLGTTLASSSTVGILVRRVLGKRRVGVGRVPLGRRLKGRRRIRWDLRVNGRRLSPGRYELVFRAFDRRGRVADLSRPFKLTVRRRG
jgi:uncharacterized delta-60 repeat protein